jgi:hypothetical protein
MLNVILSREKLDARGIMTCSECDERGLQKALKIKYEFYIELSSAAEDGTPW